MIKQFIQYLNDNCTNLSSSQMKGSAIEYMRATFADASVISISCRCPALEEYFRFNVNIDEFAFCVYQNRNTLEYEIGEIYE
ncbi:hypothetical protein ERAQ111492_00430 [Erysipelothrix aquatica]